MSLLWFYHWFVHFGFCIFFVTLCFQRNILAGCPAKSSARRLKQRPLRWCNSFLKGAFHFAGVDFNLVTQRQGPSGRGRGVGAMMRSGTGLNSRWPSAARTAERRRRRCFSKLCSGLLTRVGSFQHFIEARCFCVFWCYWTVLSAIPPAPNSPTESAWLSAVLVACLWECGGKRKFI